MCRGKRQRLASISSQGTASVNHEAGSRVRPTKGSVGANAKPGSREPNAMAGMALALPRSFASASTASTS
eukprot:6135538-Lingulodinium_polyedra.AAC.1